MSAGPAQKSVHVPNFRRPGSRKGSTDTETGQQSVCNIWNTLGKKCRHFAYNVYRFNKRPEDFPTLRAYNDYLEEVEDITFNLINEVDVAETEARITAYELENKEAIAANEARLVKFKSDNCLLDRSY